MQLKELDYTGRLAFSGLVNHFIVKNEIIKKIKKSSSARSEIIKWRLSQNENTKEILNGLIIVCSLYTNKKLRLFRNLKRFKIK